MLDMLDGNGQNQDADAKALADMHLLAYMPFKPITWPIGLSAVVGLLRRNGFRADADSISSLLTKHGVDVPRFGFYPSAVLSLIAWLTQRREWLPGKHDDKKTRSQLMLEKVREAGMVELWVAGMPCDLRGALLSMVDSDDRERREKMFTVVLALLEAEGVVV